MALSPDPRFGNDAPVAASSSIRLPSSLTFSISGSRTATLSNPNDPLSLMQLLEWITVNGRTFQSTYSRAANTITLRTPLQRQTVLTLDPASARVTQIQPPGVAFSYRADDLETDYTPSGGGRERNRQRPHRVGPG